MWELLDCETPTKDGNGDVIIRMSARQHEQLITAKAHDMAEDLEKAYHARISSP